MIRIETDPTATEEVRKLLRDTCRQNGFNETDSALIADLAVRAVETGLEAMERSTNAAPFYLREIITLVSVMAMSMVMDSGREQITKKVAAAGPS